MFCPTGASWSSTAGWCRESRRRTSSPVLKSSVPTRRKNFPAAAFTSTAILSQQDPFGLTCNTDMNHFVRAGIPTVIIGPGTITVAHKPNESVELEQLEKTCAVDEAVIRALLR